MEAGFPGKCMRLRVPTWHALGQARKARGRAAAASELSEGSQQAGWQPPQAEPFLGS